ncbi:MAG: pirin family protein [Rhodospirillales bacterium]|nr:pirin family protein [Rhodospirillales bacterium]
MIAIRPSNERGAFDHGWLVTSHTFSFSEYQDPAHMGFRALRVINEDIVRPGKGFGTHGHRDMEIVTYVLSDALEHKDSLGNGSIISPGEVQRMSAGTGIRHSEFNASADADVHLLQIWIVPEREGIAPGYEQKTFPIAAETDRLLLVASRSGAAGSVTIHQDANLYAATLSPGGRVAAVLAPGRHAWVQVARGALKLNGAALAAGDGAQISDETAIDIRGPSGGEFLLFDLA